jgi:hypothetical protein
MLKSLHASGIETACEEGAWLIGTYLPGKSFSGVPGQIRHLICVQAFDLLVRMPELGMWRLFRPVQKILRLLRTPRRRGRGNPDDLQSNRH